ncbi:TatD family hydrolase [Teredinibacter purpureus]|uniref:TatD family hydrolase n=1 Tax=Teredinibacter purpureus TaxID=2731756 RepID=UPI0005F878AB|nr:TatD family hydrolase [Teredinibacter purpureus]
MLIDSHCHFDFDVFTSQRTAILRRCDERGVQHIVMPGTSPAQWNTLQQLCEHNPVLHYGVGIHPWWIDSVIGDGVPASEPPHSSYFRRCERFREALHAHVAQPSCIAIGECGLDATRNIPLKDQVAVLEWHCAIAVERQMPLIVHCVKAHNELVQCINKFSGLTGVVHAFSGSLELAQQYWQRGFYLGVGGTITYARAAKTRRAITAMPLESLLLETDAPDMPLQGKQGQVNSPEYLPEIAQELAVLRQVSTADIAVATRNNTLRLFSRLAC